MAPSGESVQLAYHLFSTLGAGVEGGGQRIFNCGSCSWEVCDLVGETNTWTYSGDKIIM